MGTPKTPEAVEIRLDWTAETMKSRLDRLRNVLARARCKDPIRILEVIGDEAAMVLAAAEGDDAPETYRSAQRTLAAAINRELQADDAPARLERVASSSRYRLVSHVSASMRRLMTGAWLVSVAALLGVVAIGVIIGRVAPWPWVAAYAGLFLATAVLGRVGEKLGVPRAALIVTGVLVSLAWMACGVWPLWMTDRTTVASVFVAGIVLTMIITRVVDGTLQRLDLNLPDPS